MIQSALKIPFIRIVLVIGLLSTAACGTRYNTIEQKDPHEGDPYVYGEIGGPPRQAANKYEPDPDADKRAQEIREKMFGAAGQAEQGN